MTLLGYYIYFFYDVLLVFLLKLLTPLFGTGEFITFKLVALEVIIPLSGCGTL